MPRAPSTCSTGGCGKTAVRIGRCETCAQAYEDARGSANARGYDSKHNQTRARLLPSAYGRPCPICKRAMRRWHPLDLHHSTPLRENKTARGDVIVHMSCNEGGEPPPDTERPPVGWVPPKGRRA